MNKIEEKIEIKSGNNSYEVAFDHNDPGKVFLNDNLYEIEILKKYGNNVFTVSLNNKVYTVKVVSKEKNKIEILGTGFIHEFDVKTSTTAVLEKFILSGKKAGSGIVSMKAPMPGMVVNIDISEGDSVDEGDKIVVIEAMKMENALASPANGIIKSIKAIEGNPVNRNDVLLEIDTKTEESE